jgi:uncharacterized protein YjcR
MVNREEARMLVASIGYEPASQKTGIKAATLRQWARRFNWNKPMIHAQSKAVTTVTKPADALASVLADDSNQTKLGLSKYAKKQAKELSENGQLKDHHAFRNITAGSSQLHNWEKVESGSGVMPRLNVYSDQTVLNVQVIEAPTAQAMD